MQEQEKSKSQLKREAHALQELGVALTKLSNRQLEHIPLPEELLSAVQQAKTIKSNAALRRHMQFIGKIMREIEDVSPIQDAYDKVVKGLAADKTHLHLIENWRERLISEGKPALTEFLSQHHCEDVQQLRQLIRQAVKEREQQKNLGSSKALFRFIAGILQ